MSADPQTFLTKKHPHPRDDHISFDEGPHIYTIDGDSDYTSVTTWVHKHFPAFDSNKIIDGMMRSPKWPQNKYYGKTKEEILAIWDANKNEAAAAGTKMHFDIECFYNECPRPNDSTEYEYFKAFLKDFGHLKAYRTEWMVFHEEYRLAGSIDMTFEDPEGNILIYDWKRCKDVKKTSPWGKCAITPEINYMPDTNYWHYVLQLNVYRQILEEKYDKRVTEMYLVVLHPDNYNKSYLRLKVPRLEEVSVLLSKLKNNSS